MKSRKSGRFRAGARRCKNARMLFAQRGSGSSRGTPRTRAGRPSQALGLVLKMQTRTPFPNEGKIEASSRERARARGRRWLCASLHCSPGWLQPRMGGSLGAPTTNHHRGPDNLGGVHAPPGVRPLTSDPLQRCSAPFQPALM